MHQQSILVEPGTQAQLASDHSRHHCLHLALELSRLERQRQQLLQAAAVLAQSSTSTVLSR